MSELPPDDVLDRIGDEVEAAQRAGRSIDPRELAERLGVDVAVVEAYQVGEQAFDPTPPTVRRILDEGRYTQPRLVSRGGMGAVYRARDARLERDVAIKILRVGAFATPTQRERFLREARAAAQLRHPHALAIHDLGEVGGELYLILEFVDGGRTFAEAASEWGWRERVLAMRDAARAVGQAHRLGLIHRDLKPDNLLVDARGHVRVVDFGLARPTDATSLTKTGMIVGTAGYLSPEQARGESSEQGPATDVWSLGVVLYEALGGAKPFPGAPLEFLAALQQRRAPTPLRTLAPNLPAQLGRVCARALAFDATDRYPDGDAFADALELALGDSAPPPSGVSVATLVVACLACLVVGALLATAARSTPEQAVASASPTPTRTPARAVAEPDQPPLDVAPLTTAADAQITHVDARAPVGVAFAVDGSLVSYGLGGLRRWRRSGKPRGSWLPGAIASVVPLRDGDWVFATPRQLVRRSIFRQGLPPAKPGAGWTIPVPGVTVVGASPSTQVLAFGAKASGVHLVHAGEGRPRRLCSPEGVLRDLVFLEEARLLIHVERQGGSRLELWDTIRSARVALTAVPSLSSVAVSPSGEVLACGFASGRLTLNAPETLARRQVLSDPRLGGGRAFDGGVGPLAFAPERSEGGALYASPARDVTDADRRLKRFTLPSGAVRDVTPPLPSSPCALTVDPAGTLALGYRDGRAELRRPPLR